MGDDPMRGEMSGAASLDRSIHPNDRQRCSSRNRGRRRLEARPSPDAAPHEIPRVTPELKPEEYARWFESELGRRVWRDERRALDVVLGDVRGDWVLDAGAGDARYAQELESEGAVVVALDLSPAMMASAAEGVRRGRRRILLTRGDVHRLPYRDGSFDVAVAVTLLCFTDRPSDVAHELARVTRIGGRVALAELGGWSTWALWRRLRARFRDGLWSSARFWTEGELRGLLKGVGLEPGRSSAAVFYPPSRPLARLLEPLDRRLGEWTSLGAAFVVVEGLKARHPTSGNTS